MSNGVKKVEEGFVSRAHEEQAPVETAWEVDPNVATYVQDLIDAVTNAINADFPGTTPAKNPNFVYTLSRLKKRC